MKTIVISDIHGLIFWKKIIATSKPEDHIVFLGDYFDERGPGPHAASQTANFLEICSLARNNPHIHMLMGNHDFQYTDFTELPTSSYDTPKAQDFNKALMDNIDLLDMVFIEEIKGKPFIFSHAGASQIFLDASQLPSVYEINKRYREKPEQFEFIWFYDGQMAENHGEDPWQSPLWIRPKALLEAAVPGYDQVVGHTPVRKIEKLESRDGDTIYFTCTFNADCLVLEH